MKSVHDTIKLKGISAAVPENIEALDNFVSELGKEYIERQKCFTGIESRHVCLEEQNTIDLCEHALDNLFERTKWKPEEIKVLILVTQCPEYQTPSTAFLLHKKYSMSTDCLVFDMNMGCSGFNVGLYVMSSILQTLLKGSKGVLVVADNSPNRLISDRENLTEIDLSNMMLFGAAAAAVALQVGDCGDVPMINDVYSDGSGWDVIHKTLDGNLRMSGLSVYEFAVSDVVDFVENFIKENQLSFDGIDFVLFHQAQKEILDELTDILEIEEEKVLTSYEEYGNTSGASQLLTAVVNRDTILKKKDVDLLFIGFGVGLSCAVTYIRIQSDIIFPLVTF